MAEKPKTIADKSKQSPAVDAKVITEPEVPKSRFSTIFKALSIFMALCILIAIGFAAGVYLKFIDVEKIARDANLAQYPVVARFLPKTNFEPVELEEETTSQPVIPIEPKQIQPPITSPLPNSQLTGSNVITKEELEQQAKIKQKEEAKRISKLARLYGGMKPETAVAIMKDLDDPTVIAIFGKMEEEQVSKLLGLFDSTRAARITQDMLRGSQPQVQVPQIPQTSRL